MMMHLQTQHLARIDGDPFDLVVGAFTQNRVAAPRAIVGQVLAGFTTAPVFQLGHHVLHLLRLAFFCHQNRIRRFDDQQVL